MKKKIIKKLTEKIEKEENNSIWQLKSGGDQSGSIWHGGYVDGLKDALDTIKEIKVKK